MLKRTTMTDKQKLYKMGMATIITIAIWVAYEVYIVTNTTLQKEVDITTHEIQSNFNLEILEGLKSRIISSGN